jgi:hypothetical protein
MQTETNHALEQAKSQARGIVEMVQALDRETAADDFTSKLSDERCREILCAHWECEASELSDKTTEELRENIAECLSGESMDDELAGFEFDEDEARKRILEDPLSVEVRSDWTNPCDPLEPSEFRILLCTGGPAVSIVGELDAHKGPSRAWIEYQDWGTPWAQLFDEIEQDTLLTYCRQFYFGE